MLNVDELLVTARLILIVVFITAGISKLINLKSFIKTLINFGIPESIHKTIGIVLPYIELSLAAFLMFSATVWWASIAAFILLIFFTGLISYNLLQGKHPSCNCFGINNKPINTFTLLRNLGLITCCLLLVLNGAQHNQSDISVWLNQIFSELELISILIWLLVVIVGAEGWIILKLIRQHGRLMLRMDNIELRLDAAGIRPASELPSSYGLKIGTKAPTFSLPNLNGDIISIEYLLTMKRPILLVFSDPGCGSCTSMIPSLAQWENEYKLEVMLVLISRGTAKENIDKLGEIHLDNVLLQTGREVFEQYKAIATPCAVRIGIDGLIDSNIVLGEIAIATLIHESIP